METVCDFFLYFCVLSEGSCTWEWTGRARRAWCTSRPSALRTPARFSGQSRQDIVGIAGGFSDLVAEVIFRLVLTSVCYAITTSLPTLGFVGSSVPDP